MSDNEKALKELLDDKYIDGYLFSKDSSSRANSRQDAWWKATAISNLAILDKLNEIAILLSGKTEKPKKGRPKKEKAVTKKNKEEKSEIKEEKTENKE